MSKGETHLYLILFVRVLIKVQDPQLISEYLKDSIVQLDSPFIVKFLARVNFMFKETYQAFISLEQVHLIL
jgi:hypothetical protein